MQRKRNTVLKVVRNLQICFQRSLKRESGSSHQSSPNRTRARVFKVRHACGGRRHNPNPGTTDRKQLVVAANYSLRQGQLPLRPRQVEREGTVGPSYRLGENLQLSRLKFCTKRPNSSAGV